MLMMMVFMMMFMMMFTVMLMKVFLFRMLMSAASTMFVIN
jgi:hypothetical protein